MSDIEVNPIELLVKALVATDEKVIELTLKVTELKGQIVRVRVEVTADFDWMCQGIGTSLSYHNPSAHKEFMEFYIQMRSLILDPSIINASRRVGLEPGQIKPTKEVE
jgi:hypothetical protein